MNILQDRFQDELEAKGPLGPWQSGFRKGRRIEDCIFVLSETVNWTRRYSKGLVAAFRDIKKPYDSVELTSLWRCMEGNGVGGPRIGIFKAVCSELCVYTNGKSEIS